MDKSFALIGNSSISAAFCCDQIANILGSKVSFKGNAIYLATEDSYWSLQEANLTPSCIIVPETSQDVSDAVKIMSSTEECKFAIKGQSHAPAAGFANINDGVTIDMTNLSSVVVNDEHTMVSVGPGAAWIEVYRYLDKLGLSVAGGRNGAVGVGGLTLGGGISYFSPRVGFACDTVLNFEVRIIYNFVPEVKLTHQIVLPCGTLANVNTSSRPDLFRALKGGANNFGVVTRIDFKPFAQGQIVGGNIVNSISEREAVFQAFSNIAGASEYDPFASLVMGLIFNSTSKAWVLSNTAIYTKPVLNPPVYEELAAIPHIADTRKITNLSILAAEAPTPKLYVEDSRFRPIILSVCFAFSKVGITQDRTILQEVQVYVRERLGTYGVSATLLSKMFDQLNTTMYTFDIPKGIVWSLAFEPLPTAVTKYGTSNGGNSLGVSPKDGNAFTLWDDTASNGLVEETAQKMGNAVAEIAKAMGLLHRFEYINYADPSQSPIQSYGKKNVDFLRRVSRKYDPKGVFQRQVPGGFKLGLHY